MHIRAAAAVAAWTATIVVTVGAGMAAITALGGEISDRSTRPMTLDQVRAALAAQPSPMRPPVATSPPPSASTLPTPTATVTVTEQPSPTVSNLTSPGGDVIASCSGNAVYLKSWVPAQNFSVTDAHRTAPGPTFVQFDSFNQQVYVSVSCTNGTPMAVITLSPRDHHSYPPPRYSGH